MLDTLLVRAQRAPSFSAHGAFCLRLVVAKEAGASRSLNRLASTWLNAPALQLSTTHCPQRPCRVLQALNSTQQLGIDEPLSWQLERPWAGRSAAPAGTRSERWTRLLDSYPLKVAQSKEAQESIQPNSPSTHLTRGAQRSTGYADRK